MVPNYNIQERSALPINSTSSNSLVAANATRNEVEHTIAANQSEPVSGESSRPVPDLPLNADRSSMVHGPASSVKALPKLNTNIKYKTTHSDVWKNVKVVSRGGKVNGKHWHFLNVTPLDNVGDQQIEYVSFRDDVVGWQNLDTPSAIDNESGNVGMNEPQVSNVYFGSHTSNSKFQQAKIDELMKWKDMNTYTEVELGNQKLITTSWVCTEKVKGGVLICKARLVAREFEEDSTNLLTNSPTCSKDSLRLMLIASSTFNWHVRSLDIKSAFLQGMKLKRDVFIEPPVEAKTSGKAWKLEHAVYGLTYAVVNW